MSMNSANDERMMLNNDPDSPSVDDANSGGNVGGNGSLKKGPWTSAEDAILVEYVTKHGEGNWNAVQKHSGLARCGKSCRLRWANHLRPDLRKGAFTQEEERRIIELHAKMGNKWARMAAELPGRTDNEIKNYWNTRIKRRQRAGLPIYPPDICLQASNENQESDDMNAFSSGHDVHHPDFMPMNNFEIPEFKAFQINPQLYPQELLDFSSNSLLNIPASSLLAQGPHSPYPNKRIRGSESLFPGLSTDIGNVIPDGSQYHNDGSVQIAQPFMLSSAYDHNSTSNHGSSSSVLPGSHAVLNGNTSSSEPTWAMKPELPSLQTQTGCWGPPSSPLPSLESVDTLIQTPPIENTQSCNLSPRNSGLLDAVLYESQTIKNSNNSSRQHDLFDTSSEDLHETEWGAYSEPISPLGPSSSSVFSEGTSLDEPKITRGYRVEESTDLFPMQYDDRVETQNEMIYSRPDFLLASNYFVTNDQTRFSGKVDTSATSSTQGYGHDSCSSNAMSSV
ncbi:hypothetical protein RD792_009943 [Penstemon davidsonii]|uniref:Transcription factor GAMYB n=1 Tax=Penstemon davidsonii TaxID=160366 RepID=A0ABR0D0F9_9LAMI|nr:hypothetical protein RD792_009943 [Penstemon davidsonii]